MATFTARHALTCTPDRFWALFLDSKWYVEMIVRGLGFPSAVLERDGEVRVIRVVPKLELPGPLQGLIGGRSGYIETGERTPHGYEWTVALDATPRIQLSGKITVEPTATGCVRVDVGTVDVNLLGLRGAVERTFETSTRDNWHAAARYTAEYLKTSG